jgi:hypothetical protein
MDQSVPRSINLLQAVHAASAHIFAANPLKTITTTTGLCQDRLFQGREYSQMIVDHSISGTNNLATSPQSRGCEPAHSSVRSFRRFQFSEKVVFLKRTQFVVENKGSPYAAARTNPIRLFELQNHILPLEPNKSLKTNNSPLGSPRVPSPEPSTGTPRLPCHRRHT